MTDRDNDSSKVATPMGHAASTNAHGDAHAAALLTGTVEVHLTQGKTATVDECDYHLVSSGRWRAACSRGALFYAVQSRGKKLAPVRMHRLILGLEDGDPRVADHINHDGLDNRRSNLRICTPKQNRWHARGYGGSSIYRGVRWMPGQRGGAGRWQATVIKDGRAFGRTHHRDEVSAALSHDRMAREAFGEFCCLNFPAIETYHSPEEIRTKELGKSSRFRGATRVGDKWQAAIKLNGKSVYLGRFSREEDAAAAFLTAARREATP